MAKMASGARFEKGSFTVPNVLTYTLNFGKEFHKYVLIIEADDASKQQIIDTGSSNNRQRAFFFMVIYPQREVNDNTIAQNTFAMTINPSSDSTAAAAIDLVASDKSINFNVVGLTSAGNYRLYVGLTYNYYIVEIK